MNSKYDAISTMKRTFPHGERSSVYCLVAVFLLFLQSCSFDDLGPKTTIEISLLEEVEDISEMRRWLQDYVKATIGRKCKVKTDPNGKVLAAVIPVSDFNRVKAALDAKAGTSPKILSFHAVPEIQPEVVNGVIDKNKIASGYMAMPFKSEPDKQLIVKSDPVLDSADFASASQFLGPNGWSISVTFSSAGAAKMDTFTRANIRKRMAIVLSGKILSAPVIQEPFSEGCQITGDFTQSEAQDLAEKCRSLPPVKFEILTKVDAASPDSTDN